MFKYFLARGRMVPPTALNCNFNTVLDVFEELYYSVDIWVGVLCHLLKFAVLSFNAVGSAWSLCSIVIP
jgi:hypothetical protein